MHIRLSKTCNVSFKYQIYKRDYHLKKSKCTCIIYIVTCISCWYVQVMCISKWYIFRTSKDIQYNQCRVWFQTAVCKYDIHVYSHCPKFKKVRYSRSLARPYMKKKPGAFSKSTTPLIVERKSFPNLMLF